ncbi:tetratricopeptide repeat protein 5-like protein, partial [Leptotrombidium deliense]
MSTIEELRKSVEQLYEYRNKYYSISPIEKYSLKECDVNAKLQETLELLQSAKEECEKKEKAVYCMLYGKALNVKREYDQLAFDYLSKSVKLNPKLTEAWNELGECYWKKGDLKASLNCFEGCLKYDKMDKVALRNLSMLLRQLGDTAIE